MGIGIQWADFSRLLLPSGSFSPPPFYHESMNGQELRKELDGLRQGQQTLLEQQQTLLEGQSINQSVSTAIMAWNKVTRAAEPPQSQVLTQSSIPPAPASRDREITIKVAQKNAKINTSVHDTPQALEKETMRRFAGMQELKTLKIEAAHAVKPGDIKFSMKDRCMALRLTNAKNLEELFGVAAHQVKTNGLNLPGNWQPLARKLKGKRPPLWRKFEHPLYHLAGPQKRGDQRRVICHYRTRRPFTPAHSCSKRSQLECRVPCLRSLQERIKEYTLL